jgi:histone deacetylase complex regulatory component SIN3
MEKNWSKSLDIRSVTFKAFEKKHEQSKSYVDELKHRAGERAHRRDANHLKGGTRSCEYYVMLEIFEHIEVYDDNDLSDPRIANDSPMNLVDKVYLERTDKLPHFRFLMNDDYFLDLTNSLVYASI